MSWYSAFPEAVLLVVAAFLPGLALGYAARLRGLFLWATAPVFSVALAGGGALVSQYLGIPWGWGAYLGVSVLCAGLAWAVVRLLERLGGPVEPWQAPLAPTAVGAAIAAPFLAWALKAGMVIPNAPAQTYDAVFHLSGLRYILETGKGSSLAFSAVANTQGGATFYPAGWHDLVVMGAYKNPVVAANVMSFVLVCLVLPLGVGALATVLAPKLRWAGLFGALLAAVPAAFPVRLLTWGTLWPYTLGITLLPASLALAVVLLTGLRVRRWGALVTALLLIGLTVFSGGIAHPSAGITLLMVLLALLVVRIYSTWNAGQKGAAAIFGALLVADLVFLRFVLTTAGDALRKFEREPTVGLKKALVKLVSDGFDSPYDLPYQFWPGIVLLLAGTAALLLGKQHRWFIASAAAVGYLWVLSVAIHLPGYWLLGAWYFEPQRLAGTAALFSTVFWALGAAYITDHIRAKRERYAAALVAAALVLSTGGLNALIHRNELRQTYVMDDDPEELVDTAELALIERSKEYLDPNGRVLGSPFHGTSFFYVLNGQPVTHTAIGGMWNVDTDRLAAYLGQEGYTEAVCERLRNQGVKYMYVDTEIFWPEHWWHPYFYGIDPTSKLRRDGGLKLLDNTSTAALYELTGCR
ncbi:DUF6541 family protein [Buchananella felis]|uniref:DUF6541 family protein n=1 Tax=Buchananella felis TaxID=3231492 RepID=UPI003528B7EC